MSESSSAYAEPKETGVEAPERTRQVVFDQSDFSDMNEDDRKLAELGYKPVFKREFTLFSAFSFALSISGLFATVATTFSYPLSSGGASAAVWCWLVSGAGCMCIAFSVAELVSAYPTSGGLYFTLNYLAPKKWVPVVSWVDGWLNVLGQIAGIASTDYGAAQLLLAAVSIGSDFTYFPTDQQTVGVCAAILVFHGLVNSLSTRALERFSNFYVVFHICVLISGCIALLAKQHDKHSASYVFTHTESSSGWNPIGWSWMFGFLSVSWTMTDYDATAHICEEMDKPERKAPLAISTAMAFTYVAGFLFNIVLCFCMGDPAEILASPIAQPVAQIFYNVLGKGGGIFFTVAAFMIMNFVGITATHSCSRTFWAVARDEMLPLSRYWYSVTKKTAIPLASVWLTIVLCILIDLIGLGSYITISAIFNVCAIALDWSYCIPILCKLIFPGNFKAGPWHLGKFSKFINAWAVMWTSYVTIIFLCPTVRPVTPQNMNYAVVFFVAIGLFSLLYWVISGHKYYTGPRLHNLFSEPVTEATISATQSARSKEQSKDE